MKILILFNFIVVSTFVAAESGDIDQNATCETRLVHPTLTAGLNRLPGLSIEPLKLTRGNAGGWRSVMGNFPASADSMRLSGPSEAPALTFTLEGVRDVTIPFSTLFGDGEVVEETHRDGALRTLSPVSTEAPLKIMIFNYAQGRLKNVTFFWREGASMQFFINTP